MKQGRTPDRVHVVREPQDSYRAPAPSNLPAPQNTRAMEIVRTLAQISDKLKRSEAERYELLAELREYRKSLNELEDKAEKSEKAYQDLESKIKNREAAEVEVTQRQARFERALKETESKLVQASAGQNLLISRLKDTEDRQAMITQRVDESITQQARLDRQMEKIGQDKGRMLRKVERMEEILTETQDTLKARALVLLTDQSAAAGGGFPQIAAYGDRPEQQNADAPWWRQSMRVQSVGMASMIVAALLLGWTINQVQQPEIPQIAVLENGGLARINLDSKQWEPVSAEAPAAAAIAEPTLTPAMTSQDEETPTTTTAAEQSPEAQNVLSASDDELLAALEENPDALAAQLNEIAPEVSRELDDVTAAPEAITAPKTSAYNPLSTMQTTAFAQDPALANRVAAERGTQALTSRMQKDPALPAAIQKLEDQAFAGTAEAQHDLAAIYTAGRAGVTQNFEKAAFWFREAATNKVPNASYNLGVLYHQGLGVDHDLDRAIYWYREAAKLGHPEAQYNLGIAHIEGIGTTYNAPLAAAFFESAANEGVIEAAYNLGLIYENGLIDKAKAEDAMLWYKIAADGGSTDANAALQQLANAMQIGMEDVNKMVERMQSIYTSSHGRRAGKIS